jgi:hypothetical protein
MDASFISKQSSQRIAKRYNIMNPKLLTIVCMFFLAATGLRAQANLNSIVYNLKSDPKNAPAIAAMAVVENPKLTARIVTAALTALPKQSVEIVRALLKVDPKEVTLIIRAAILAQPSLAVQFTSMAVAMYPDQSAAIIKAATSVAPAEVRDAIAAPSDNNLGNGQVSGGNASTPSFPTQPIQPLTSPAS